MRLGSLAFELIPLAAFFVGNAMYGLFVAAAASVVSAAVVLSTIWLLEKRIAIFPVFSVGLSAALTAAAFLLSEAVFIKIQPTVFNGLFSAALLLGICAGFPVMRAFFGNQFRLTDRTWRMLSLRWGIFLGCLAIGNEIAWRNLTDDGWVIVKVFVIPSLTTAFALSQLPLTLSGRIRPGGQPPGAEATS